MPTIGAPTETALVKQLLAYLALRGIPAWRQNQGAMAAGDPGSRRFIRFSGAWGISDILGLIPPTGRFLAVEAKMPGCKLTADQEGFLANVRAAGGLVGVVRSLGDLEQLLAAIGSGTVG